jgi:hypothetical protein
VALSVIEVLELDDAGLQSLWAAKPSESLLQPAVGLEVERVVINDYCASRDGRPASRLESGEESSGSPTIRNYEADTADGEQRHSQDLIPLETKHS